MSGRGEPGGLDFFGHGGVRGSAEAGVDPLGEAGLAPRRSAGMHHALGDGGVEAALRLAQGSGGGFGVAGLAGGECAAGKQSRRDAGQEASDQAACRNRSPEEKQLNRRVEVQFSIPPLSSEQKV